ncbi:hypothetical protein V6N13_088642 [Hibiscus sabdariffa]
MELGHFLAAFPKKVKLSIPLFIPNITLGSFGAITQFKPILPDRSTQVGISLVGPFAGAALSFSMFVVGLLLSSNPDAAGDLVQGSLLLGLISGATLGNAAKKVVLHIPSFMNLTDDGRFKFPGCLLTLNLNLDSLGMLTVQVTHHFRAVQVPSYSYIAFSFEIFDSSLHFLQGAFGKGVLVGCGLTTYTLVGLGVIGGPLPLSWGLYVLILICQRTPEKPCLNDVTEVGTWRKTAVGVAIFLLVLT